MSAFGECVTERARHVRFRVDEGDDFLFERIFLGQVRERLLYGGRIIVTRRLHCLDE